jgi:tripartite ATP-independent transporter DctP family solute receptor
MQGASKKKSMEEETMRFSGWLLAAAIIVLAPVSAGAQKIELKLGHVAEPGSQIAQTADEFAKRANAKLNGKAEVVVFPSSQLGSDKDMGQKLKLNQLQLWVPSTIMSSVAPEFGVFEMPYIIRDRNHMKRVVEKLNDPFFQPAAKAKGVLILGTWENGFRHVTNNVRPIKTPDDLKGIKLRVPQGEWRVKMFRAYGANPTPMAYGEVFTALKTGVMDGQENPYPQIWGGKFHEVQKYISLTGHVYSPAWIVASSEYFPKLPADVQKALQEAARETEGFARDLGAKFDNELLDKMVKESGIKVNEVDKAAFVAASKDVYDEFGKQVPNGAELIKQIQALAN